MTTRGCEPLVVDETSIPGCIIERDVGIQMKDGLILRADVYRPKTDPKVPVIMTAGPYGKGISWTQEKNPTLPQWKGMCQKHPEILQQSSGKYITWETVDPERWIPWGYAVIRVDSRGNNRSPGKINIFSRQDSEDYVECITWAGTQSWSNGKVGLCGISYYAITQWQVAQLQPPHLAAMIPWEGASDPYREIYRHGGILSNTFMQFLRAVLATNQHGRGTHMDHWLGESSSGPERLTEEEMAANFEDPIQPALHAKLITDDFYQSRQVDFSKIKVPLLSAASWAGFGLHQRGNFEGYLQAASSQKWLEIHPGKHEEWFYLDQSLELEKKFFDHFLMGVDNGMDRESPVLMQVRHPGERFHLRKEQEWPLNRTRWTKFYLDVDQKSIKPEISSHASKATFRAQSGNGLIFNSDPIDQEMEITGPMAAHLRIASSTTDADLFLTLRAYDPNGKEIIFVGTVDPKCVLSQGCLRASHRALDPERTRDYRPFHSHTKEEKLIPGDDYNLDVEMWPTCIVLPKGSTLQLLVDGKDFCRPDDECITFGIAGKLGGSGICLHTHPVDRNPQEFDGETTLMTGIDEGSWLLLPIIPTSTE
eukprot:TRINITY_DN17188_c0_g1_i1.p1 TRINITY_DN17188_c0_g1~~TRINITY_DN17188_c0_g1_i1.p1  ORF type:complete len:593 (+),score=171.14 TRINITY_DN17188_c0_g1_i1:61-1839(+)